MVATLDGTALITPAEALARLRREVYVLRMSINECFGRERNMRLYESLKEALRIAEKWRAIEEVGGDH